MEIPTIVMQPYGIYYWKNSKKLVKSIVSESEDFPSGPFPNEDILDSTDEESTDVVDHANESSGLPCVPDIDIEELENYSDSDSDDDIEEVSEQVREQYVRTHGLRRHTAGRMALLTPNLAPRTFSPNLRFEHQSTTIEPTLLTNRLHHLQQEQHQYNTLISTPENEQQFYPELQSTYSHQRYPHSTSYNGLPIHSNIAAVSENCHEQQKNNHWLSPPTFNPLRMFFDEIVSLFTLLFFLS